MIATISPRAANALLDDGNEIALLDVREIVPFGRGHPLLATNLPLSVLELRIGGLVPRRDTRVVLIDGGEGFAALAAERLGRLGYVDLRVIEGGTPAWQSAGLALFPELEVPSKGFGAFAKRFGKPRLIEPDALARALSSGEDWIVLDSRPRAEYRAGNIPGSTDAPGADVVRWFDDLVPDPNTRVVVNCMSATRGTLGGLSLMAAGVPNEVHVLNHGTRGWLLAGHELERGAERFPGAISESAAAGARERAARIRERADLRTIDHKTLAAWRGERGRTTYVFDVRTPAEFADGHLPGAVNAPEGSVVMGPDRYFATLNARIVLTDDDTVRATVTALWLAQMGWGEIAILEDGADGATESGPGPAPRLPAHRHPTVSPQALAERLAAGEVDVVDVGGSDAFVAEHVRGAVWCLRSALPGYLDARGGGRPLVLASPDGTLAGLAAQDLRDLGDAPVEVLDGGTSAWRDAGYEMASGEENLAVPRDDHWLASSERPGDRDRNVRDYLAWETTLLDDIEASGTMRYRNLIWDE